MTNKKKKYNDIDGWRKFLKNGPSFSHGAFALFNFFHLLYYKSIDYSNKDPVQNFIMFIRIIITTLQISYLIFFMSRKYDNRNYNKYLKNNIILGPFAFALSSGVIFATIWAASATSN